MNEIGFLLLRVLERELAQVRQERDEARNDANENAETWASERRENERLRESLQYIAGYDVAGYDAHLRSEDVARAALTGGTADPDSDKWTDEQIANYR